MDRTEETGAPGCTRREFGRRTLVGGLLAALGAAITACTGGAETGEHGDGHVDVTAFGAVGDGVADDTAALQRALAGVATGQQLRFPAGGIFCHDDVLTVRTAGVTLSGPGELRATDEAASALRIEADDVTVDGLRLGISETTQRWSAPDQHKVFVGAVAGVVVRDIRITGSAAAGLFAKGSHGFRFERVSVSGTRADGIHMTAGAHHGVVDRPEVSGSGDDGVAVVSYLDDDVACHDIEIVAPVVDGTTGGRGVSVVGGDDITYRDVSVADSAAAAVYVACEGEPYNTFDTNRVTVIGGTLTGANVDSDIDHGAVLVYCGRAGGRVDRVTVSDLDVTGTRRTASRQIGVVADGDTTAVSEVSFRGLRLADDPTPYQGNVPVARVDLDDVTADGRTVDPGAAS